MESTIAERYAQSMFSLAKEEQCEEQTLEELRFVDQVFTEYPDFLRLLDSPASTQQEKETILEQTFAARLCRYTMNLLCLLCERSRISCFHELYNNFEECYYLEHNILAVTAVTAIELSDALTGKLIAKLEQVTGKRIVLKKVVDRSVMGGILLKTASQQLDGTVQNRLHRLTQEIHNAIV